MGSRALLFLVFLCALGASGFFLYLTSRDATPRAAEPAISGLEEARAEAPRGPAELESVEPPEQESVARSLVEELPGSPEAPEVVQGRPEAPVRSKVSGRVVDDGGSPIAGAKVVAGGGNEIVFELDADLPASRPDRAEATTDAEGRFELEVAHASGALTFQVNADGFAPYRKADVPVRDEGPTELDDFELETGVLLSGVVVDPSGKGVAGAEIIDRGVNGHASFFSFGLARRPIATTASDGTFRITQLAAGAYRLQVRSEEHPDLTVEGLADEAGREYGGLVWNLGPGAIVRGTVIGIPADERGELFVQATRSGDGMSIQERGRRAEVDASGSFVVRGLTPDKYYDLTAQHGRRGGFGFFGRSRSEVAKVRAGDVGVTLRYQPEGSLSFQLMDARTRTPIEGFTVSAGLGWGVQLRDEDGAIQRYHPGGRVRFGGLRPTSVDDRVTLSVEATGYESFEREDIALRVGQELDLGQIFLEPVPILRVTVRTTEGVPIEGASVRLQRDTGDEVSISRRIEISEDSHSDHVVVGEGRSGRTDENGVVELTSYPGEACKLIVRADGFAPVTDSIDLPRDTLAVHEVRMLRGGDVVVRVLDADGTPLPGAKVAHREPSTGGGDGRMALMMGDFGGMKPAVADSDGIARFENLQEGVHSFCLQEDSPNNMFFGGGGEMVMVAGMGTDDGAEWNDVQVLEGETAELTLHATPRGSLHGTVLEAGAELPGATLKLREAKEEGEDDPMAMAFARFGGGPGATAKSNGKGEFEFEDVKVGRYVLEVSHPTRRMPDEYELEVREGRNTTDVDLPISIIEGRITDVAGNPLAGLTVRAEKPREEAGGERRNVVMMFASEDGENTVLSDGSPALGDSVKTDADGRYSLRGVAPDTDLVVRAEGREVQPGTSRRIRLAPNETKDGVDFQLEAGGEINVEVLASDGSPARMAMVTARHLEDTELDPKNEFIQRGTGKFTGLKPGRWSVSARKVGPSGGGDPVEREVVVRAGQAADAVLRFE